MDCEYCVQYPLCAFMYNFARKTAKRTRCPENKDHSIADYIEDYLRKKLKEKEVLIR